MPTFSIITATFNSEKFIARAAKTLLGQTHTDFEWIVQDGKSSDKTVSMLNECGDSRIKAVSEKDSGIYDAWNKAVARASGDWLIFLGADDCLFTPTTLEQCAAYLSRLDDGIDFAFGAVAICNNGSPQVLLNPTMAEAYSRLPSGMGFPFPATFIRSYVFETEKFDASYAIAGDFDLVSRLVTDSNLARIPMLVAYMESDGISMNEANRAKGVEEWVRVLSTGIASRAHFFVKGYVKNYNNDASSLVGFIVDEETSSWTKLLGLIPWIKIQCYRKGRLKYRLFGCFTILGIRDGKVYLFNAIRVKSLGTHVLAVNKASLCLTLQ